MAPSSMLRFLFHCCFPLLLLAQPDMKQKYYGNCPLYSHCGKFGGIYFPFSNTTGSECGLPIRGCNNSYGKADVQLGNQTWFEIIGIDRREEPNLIIVQDSELQKHLPINCSNFKNDITSLLPSSSMKIFQINNSITLYRCKRTLSVSIHESFFTYTKCPHYDIHYSIHPENGNLDKFFPSSSCSKIQVPFDPKYLTPNVSDPFRFMTAKLHIKVNIPEKCVECYKTVDICPDEGESYCGKAKKKSKPKIWEVVVIVFSADFGVGVLILVIFCYGFKLVRLWRNKSKAHKAFQAFLRSHGPLAVRRYSYSDIKKITKSFKEKLGQGGYGGVFKGKLDDGCQVAVKILSDSKGNGEDFVNEVASISRTSHVNIVTLLGFCFEGSQRALVYEFMPNGSLEKFIYKNNPSMSNHQLDIEILYQIVVGVARGLEYLHKGCNTRILHFDIKPHNVLLDENFIPKISDFGLAKICHKKESIVSMLDARGTIGYIAPEVFNRSFGEVSHKSDVYSYGMMILEMVGRKNNDVEVDYTSEIYFPHWIYKHLELNEELTFSNITDANDRDLIRKMIIVSLWCIQTNPVQRPTIERVVEMLAGRVETLQIPPKPYLSSPPISPSRFSTISMISQ